MENAFDYGASAGTKLATAMHVTMSTGSAIFAQATVPQTWTPIICALIGLFGVYLQLVYQDKKDVLKNSALARLIGKAVRDEADRRDEEKARPKK